MPHYRIDSGDCQKREGETVPLHTVGGNFIVGKALVQFGFQRVDALL